METKLADLHLRLPALRALLLEGFETVADMRHLSRVEILQRPGVGYRDLRKVLAKLGRNDLTGSVTSPDD